MYIENFIGNGGWESGAILQRDVFEMLNLRCS